MQTGDVGDLQEEGQGLENFHVQSTGDKELEGGYQHTESGKSANQATEIGRILIL